MSSGIIPGSAFDQFDRFDKLTAGKAHGKQGSAQVDPGYSPERYQWHGKVDTPVHPFSVIHFDFTLTPRDKSVPTPQGRRLFVFERNISLPEGCLDDFVRFFLYFGSSEDVGAHPAPQPHSKYPCRYGNRSKKGRALYKTGRENHRLDACLHTASKNQYWNK